VDADFPIRDLLGRILEEAGAVVVCAKSGREARDILAKRAVQLAYIAVVLPDDDGEEVADVAGGLGAKVVLMSGHPNAIRRNISDKYLFLQKPFRMTDVVRLARGDLPPRKNGRGN
jgi:DNA-binding NtrC family response regulator